MLRSDWAWGIVFITVWLAVKLPIWHWFSDDQSQLIFSLAFLFSLGLGALCVIAIYVSVIGKTYRDFGIVGVIAMLILSCLLFVVG